MSLTYPLSSLPLPLPKFVPNYIYKCNQLVYYDFNNHSVVLVVKIVGRIQLNVSAIDKNVWIIQMNEKDIKEHIKETDPMCCFAVNESELRPCNSFIVNK